MYVLLDGGDLLDEREVYSLDLLQFSWFARKGYKGNLLDERERCLFSYRVGLLPWSARRRASLIWGRMTFCIGRMVYYWVLLDYML